MGASSSWCSWGPVQGSGGWSFPVKNEGKGEGVGEVGAYVYMRELGTCERTGKSMRTRLSKLPFSKPAFSFSPKEQGAENQ